MKPVIQDLADIIQLSWKIHEVQMQQAQIQKHVTKNEHESPAAVIEIYQDLCAHEHKAIEAEISNAGANASLISLKRTHADMWHRQICFKGVPGLQFVLERVIQQSSHPRLRPGTDIFQTPAFTASFQSGQNTQMQTPMRDSIPVPTEGHHSLQYYQDQLMLLEQENQKTACQEQEPKRQAADQPNSPEGYHALLEQQNKERLLIAREQQEAPHQHDRQPLHQGKLRRHARLSLGGGPHTKSDVFEAKIAYAADDGSSDEESTYVHKIDPSAHSGLAATTDFGFQDQDLPSTYRRKPSNEPPSNAWEHKTLKRKTKTAALKLEASGIIEAEAVNHAHSSKVRKRTKTGCLSELSELRSLSQGIRSPVT